MTKTKKVAIVLLNWNGKDLLKKFLPSVIENSIGENLEIIVADNGSTDDSISVMKSDFPNIKVLDLKENYGFAKGYNVALKQVEADYYVLLNSDVEVTKGWIDPCIQRMEENENIVAVQPKILSYERKDYFEYAGAAGGFIDKYGYPFCRGRFLNVVEKDEGQYNEATPIFWASGACMFITAKAFKEADGFDADFWAHMEEIDLCWRLKNKGYSVWYEPKSVIYHLGGGTLSYDSPKKIYLNFRNNLWMLYKNLPKGKAFVRFIKRMILDGIAAVKFLVDLNFNGFNAVLKAHGAFYNKLRKLRKQRRELRTTTTQTFHKEILSKSIMWRFFILRKRKFSELNLKKFGS